MYLWSIEIEAVLTAMSCFRLLCEEADIRCRADEVAVTSVLPNYNVYMDLASASMALTTGNLLCQKATIQQVTTTLATSKNVLFPGHNHLLTTGTDDMIIKVSDDQYKWYSR